MVPTTAALAEPLPLIRPIALDPSTAVCGIICRERRRASRIDIDHRALRVEAVGDAGQQQESGDQRQRELAVDPVDAGGQLDRARRNHTVERRARMPEEIDRAQVALQRVEDENDVGPEQDRMGEPRQLHHQQEHQQADDEILLRVGALPVDRDFLEFPPEVPEGVEANADVERDDDAGSRPAAATCRDSPADT